MGFEGKLRITDQAQQLEGYQGDKRAQTAEIIIPRSHVGGAANDIGFKEQEDGTWSAIISDYDRSSGQSARKSAHAKGCRGYDQKWLKKLTQRYAYHKLKEELANNNFYIEQEREEDGQIYLECTGTL